MFLNPYRDPSAKGESPAGSMCLSTTSDQFVSYAELRVNSRKPSLEIKQKENLAKTSAVTH